MAAGAAAVAARRRAADNQTEVQEDVAAGGPPQPDLDDIALVTTPLTGDEISKTNIDDLAVALVAERVELFPEGENRIVAMKDWNGKDALLPASLRRNDAQSSPLRPIVEDSSAITPEIVPIVARDPSQGYRLAPSRIAER